MSITIREKDSGAALAEAEPGADVLAYEGNLYFDPRAVHQEILHVSERTYTCPMKGTCHWVDYLAPDGRTVRDVAWIYEDPKQGPESIRGRFGFEAGTCGTTRQEG